MEVWLLMDKQKPLPKMRNLIALPTIDFEGVSVKPSRGVYRCPFGCGDPRYPVPKWKTEKGFRAHMEQCWRRPSRIQPRKPPASAPQGSGLVDWLDL